MDTVNLIPNEEKTPDGSVLSAIEDAGIDQSVPVGITIAYKRQLSGFHETMTPSRTSSGYQTPPTNVSSSTTPTKPNHKNRSFQVFLECGIVYAVCMILPTVAGFLYDWYAIVTYQRATGTTVVDDASLFSYFSRQVVPEEWLEPSYWCTPANGESSWSAYFLSPTGLCSAVAARQPSVISEDVTAWSDTFTISAFALLLAAIRIAIIQATVPKDEETTALAQTMIRCKSAHLLSADYVVTPISTPRPSIRAIEGSNINLPDLQGTAVTEPPTTTLLQPKPPSIASSHSIGTGVPRSSSSSSAAPRYATALFRSCYTAAAAVLAYVLFHDANFWPVYAGGTHGRTANCWDLSGNLAVWGVDSDFDHHNVALKHYFLWQASYHYHSAVFYGVSRISVWWSATPQPAQYEPAGASIRRLLQHAVAIVLIGIAYLFSSLRRLCAVGLFCFDVSSFFLHCLQVCVNAPEGSPWRQRQRVAAILWLLVIPSFVVTRFCIWPLLWYSATFESATWLRQLETTLWVGSATVVRTAVHGLMAGIEVLSVVYFRRLSQHPHLQRVLYQQKDNAALARQLFRDTTAQQHSAAAAALPSQ